MRVVLLLCIVSCVVLAPFASAQEAPRRGVGPVDMSRRQVGPAGGKNLWGYMLFMILGLGTVYIVFRGNKRA